MNEPQFDANDQALQNLLQSTKAPPPPSLSTHQFAAHVQERLETPKLISWKLQFPLALSAAGAMAFFFMLQSPEQTLAPQTSRTEIAWDKIEVNENDTAQWQVDIFNEANFNEDEDIENLIFADIEVNDAFTQQYDESSSEAFDALDDEALERLDQILNDALKNRGG